MRGAVLLVSYVMYDMYEHCKEMNEEKEIDRLICTVHYC